MTPKRNPPMTEAEWDAYVLANGRQFFHCLWLAINQPAPKAPTGAPTKGKGDQP